MSGKINDGHLPSGLIGFGDLMAYFVIAVSPLLALVIWANVLFRREMKRRSFLSLEERQRLEEEESQNMQW
jgi:hypothetical protein